MSRHWNKPIIIIVLFIAFMCDGCIELLGKSWIPGNIQMCHIDKEKYEMCGSPTSMVSQLTIWTQTMFK